jgi:hypothetical protein
VPLISADAGSRSLPVDGFDRVYGAFSTMGDLRRAR